MRARHYKVGVENDVTAIDTVITAYFPQIQDILPNKDKMVAKGAYCSVKQMKSGEPPSAR